MFEPDEYLETQVMTATPHQLHLMVVDGAIRFAKQAEAALAEEDFETSHFSLNRSREFVNELIAGLNGEQAERLVEQLKGLFAFAYQNLVRADLERDPQLIQNALRVLELHRETWQQLGQTLVAEQQQTPPDPQNNPYAETHKPHLGGHSWTS